MRHLRFEPLESRQCLSVNVILLKDIHINGVPGEVEANSSQIEELYEYKKEVFFRANTGQIGSELWKTDGTAEGTILVKDITPNNVLLDQQTSSSTPRGFVEANGFLFFTADVSRGRTTRTELWRTDGTADGTVKVIDTNVPTGLSPDIVGVLNDHLFLGVGNVESNPSNYDLWKVDGIENGNELVKTFTGGSTEFPYGVSPWLAYRYHDELFFSAADVDHGVELWKTDGSSAGTHLVFDSNPGTDHGYPLSPVEINDKLYFVSDLFENVLAGSHIHKTDGTTSGTSRVSTVLVDWETDILVAGDLLYFTGFTSEFGFEPYRTDGTAEGTIMLADTFIIESEFSGQVDGYVVGFDRVFFLSATSQQDVDGLFYNTLWSTQGTPESTFQLSSNIVAQSNEWSPVEFGGELYFTHAGKPDFVESKVEANDVLGRTDGTPGGTVAIDGPGDKSWQNAVPKLIFDDRLLMVGRTDAAGQELWLYDPQSETYEAIDIGEGDFGSVASSITTIPVLYQDMVLASLAESPDTGDELWVLRLDAVQLPGDSDGNGVVDFADFLVLAAHFGKENVTRAQGDNDDDGIVGFADFLILAENFGKPFEF